MTHLSFIKKSFKVGVSNCPQNSQSRFAIDHHANDHNIMLLLSKTTIGLSLK